MDADSFSAVETPGQPHDRPRAEGIRDAKRIALGQIRCFLESIGKNEFAWAVGTRAL